MKTKERVALSQLRKNTWVSSGTIKAATGENDLRSVRRLREHGYDIQTRVMNGSYQYKRTNSL